MKFRSLIIAVLLVMGTGCAKLQQLTMPKLAQVGGTAVEKPINSPEWLKTIEQREE